MRRKRKRFMVGYKARSDLIYGGGGRGASIAMTAQEARRELIFFDPPGSAIIFELVPVDLEAKAKK